MTRTGTLLLVAALVASCSDDAPLVETAAHAAVSAPDPLPSWNDGPTKRAITEFVDRAVRTVPVAERIAVFDNDGTLWPEQPMFAELAFTLDRVKALAAEHPAWKREQPFAAILAGNPLVLAVMGKRGVTEVVAATHAGMTNDEFSRTAADWIATARHPTLHRLYTELAYQPMLELLAYLRANGFSTYIVSGGDVEFMRPWTERVYGVPPERVIGSRAQLEYARRDGVPVLERRAKVDLLVDKAGKPVGIQQAIGRRPIAAFGNSDGDFEMLEWTTSAPGPRLGVLVHHTDAEREFAYDRTSPIGRLARALDQAPAHGWVVVDMKRDWSVVFAAASAKQPAAQIR